MMLKKWMQNPTLLFVNNFLPGGSHTASADLAEMLAKNGWQVMRTSGYRNKALRMADMLLTCLRGQYQVADIAVFSGSAFLWAEWTAIVSQAIGKPVTLSLHGGSLPQFAGQNPARVRRLLARAQVVTVPSQYLYESMLAYRSDLTIIPNGLDTTCYAYRLRDPARPRLVWLRAFHRLYQPMLVPPVLARLQGAFPDIHIRMVGPVKDDSLSRTLAAADALGVRERITIIPGVPKAAVPAELAQGDIFLNTTDADNQPVSVLEAMASGLCVVSTNAGGLPHLIRHGVDGLLCPPGDVDALATAVQEVLTMPGLSARLSAGACERVVQMDWSAVLPQWEQLFRSVAP